MNTAQKERSNARQDMALTLHHTGIQKETGTVGARRKQEKKQNATAASLVQIQCGVCVAVAVAGVHFGYGRRLAGTSIPTCPLVARVNLYVRPASNAKHDASAHPGRPATVLPASTDGSLPPKHKHTSRQTAVTHDMVRVLKYSQQRYGNVQTRPRRLQMCSYTWQQSDSVGGKANGDRWNGGTPQEALRKQQQGAGPAGGSH